MRDSVLTWMRSLACFYLLLSTMLHLLPEKRYERYVRFFMGLLLIWILCTPLLAILGKASDYLASYQAYYQQEMEKLDEEDALRMQSLYIQEGASRLLKKEEQQEGEE